MISPDNNTPALVERLTRYEMQVLIGTSISGCVMHLDRTFDLPAAWKRLRTMDLIDRADGIAIITPKGEALVAAALTAHLEAQGAQGAVERDGQHYLVDDRGFPVEVGGGDVIAIIENIPAEPVLAYTAGWNDCRKLALATLPTPAPPAAVTVSDADVRRAHAAWLLALGKMDEIEVVMTTQQAYDAMRAALLAALHPSKDGGE